MKYCIKLTLLGLLGFTMLQAEQTKLYEIKSGKVSYEIKGSGNIIGSQTKTTGTKSLIFDNYGAHSLTKEEKVQTTSVMGQRQVSKNHTMVHFKEGVVYHVDMDKKRIMRRENMAAMIAGDMTVKSKAMMKQMGGKKIGQDKVLGYSCEVWDLMGMKQCIYKGIPLKIESNVMGMKHTEVATKATFGVSINKKDFRLPDFPLTNEMGMPVEKTNLGKMDGKAHNEAQETQAQMAMMMGAMTAAAQDAGVQQGQRPSASQQEQMQNSMMNAMLPMMKQEILSEEEMMRVGYECLKDADTLKEANKCNDEMNGISGKTDELSDEWSPETKKEILGEFEHYLNVILPCVKKAQLVQEMQHCMPQE